MFERFSEAARRSLGRAHENAARFSHEYIGTEHVLLGLLEVPEGGAMKALQGVGISIPAVRREVDKLVQQGPEVLTHRSKLPFTPRAKRVIDLAVHEADLHGDDVVETKHLLLGILTESEGIAAQVLMNLGLRLEDLRGRVRLVSDPVDRRPVKKVGAKAASPTNWRLTLRSLHRDFGFFAVGLTFIYALSGLAVNHIGDWDPSFSHFKKLTTVGTPLPQDEAAAVSEALGAIGVDDKPLEVTTTRDTITRYAIQLKGRQVRVRPDANEIVVQADGSDEKKVYALGDSLPDKDWEAAVTALHRIGISEEPAKVEKTTYPVRDIDITFEGRNIRVQDFKTGYDIFDEGQKPRFFLRAANWLHLNRGKAGWKWIADGYAIALLFLACSGMLMVRGRKGLIGRGGVFLLLGIAVPVIYLIVSGGP